MCRLDCGASGWTLRGNCRRRPSWSLGRGWCCLCRRLRSGQSRKLHTRRLCRRSRGFRTRHFAFVVSTRTKQPSWRTVVVRIAVALQLRQGGRVAAVCFVTPRACALGCRRICKHDGEGVHPFGTKAVNSTNRCVGVGKHCRTYHVIEGLQCNDRFQILKYTYSLVVCAGLCAGFLRKPQHPNSTRCCGRGRGR